MTTEHNRRPPWWMRRPKPKAFRDDELDTSTGCAFCAALDRALDDGSGTLGHASSERLALSVDLDELERRHGACSCFAEPSLGHP